MTIDFKRRLFAAQAPYYSRDPQNTGLVREICEALIALTHRASISVNDVTSIVA
jgi:hypothetical protein